MAATLALTSSGNISLVSDLGVVPSDGSHGSPLMAATLALTAWARASPNAQPGSECRFLDFLVGLVGSVGMGGAGAPVLAFILGRLKGQSPPLRKGPRRENENSLVEVLFALRQLPLQFASPEIMHQVHFMCPSCSS